MRFRITRTNLINSIFSPLFASFQQRARPLQLIDMRGKAKGIRREDEIRSPPRRPYRITRRVSRALFFLSSRVSLSPSFCFTLPTLLYVDNQQQRCTKLHRFLSSCCSAVHAVRSSSTLRTRSKSSSFDRTRSSLATKCLLIDYQDKGQRTGHI